MQVIDCLSGLGIGIDYRAETVDAFFFRHARGDQKQMSHQPFVFLGGLRQGRKVPARNDEQVDRRLRTDILDDDTTVIFVDWSRRHFSRDDFAEKAPGSSHHDFPVQMNQQPPDRRWNHLNRSMTAPSAASFTSMWS